jgi:hypothetical protein
MDLVKIGNPGKQFFPFRRLVLSAADTSQPQKRIRIRERVGQAMSC